VPAAGTSLHEAGQGLDRLAAAGADELSSIRDRRR